MTPISKVKAGALIQDLDDLVVQLVNGLAMFRDFHCGKRYTTPAQKQRTQFTNFCV